MFNKLERKYGKYAIRDLTIKLMIVYAVGYAICLLGSNANPTFITDYITFDPYMIFHGQVWRLVTWIMIPLQDNFLLYAVSIFFFYMPIGRMMESTWGEFKYNLYFFMGFLSTIIVGFVLYFLYLPAGAALGADAATTGQAIGYTLGTCVSAYHITMSIFFAYAATFPDATVLLMFIIPLQMKWLGIAYAALYGWSIIKNIYNLVQIMGEYGFVIGLVLGSVFVMSVVLLIASLIPFFVFFFGDKNSRLSRRASRYKPSEVKRRNEFKRNVENAKKAQRMVAPGSAHHKCAVCGRTEIDDPNLEFRYCSKCKGAYEYCQDHLFTHVHIEK